MSYRTCSRLMMETAFIYPRWLSPLLNNALARWRCAGSISLNGSPLRGLGIKGQSLRSSAVMGYDALACCSVDNEFQNCCAALTISFVASRKSGNASVAREFPTTSATSKNTEQIRSFMRQFLKVKRCGTRYIHSTPPSRHEVKGVYSQTFCGK